MPVTNEEIMEKLNKIESMLQTVTKEEETELKELEVEMNLEFKDAESWKENIWLSCPFRTEKAEGEEVDFFCKKQNKLCRFEGCPLNKKIESE